jgi:hypothetical protein
MKLWRPDDTARALIAARLPLGRRAVRVGALAEVAVGMTAFALPGPVTGALVATSYLGFAGFIVVALRKGWAISSCGCFGRPDTPPSYVHAALDLGAAASALWWSASVPARLGHAFAHQPWHGGALALVTFVVLALAYMAWNNPLDTVR